MKKPNNYENTQAAGEYTPVAAGGHYMKIMKVEERKNRNGDDMLVVAFDFASNDDQAGYFMEQFKNDERPEKKWPHLGVNYINVDDSNGNCSRSFKTFCSCVERSNKGFVIDWNEADFGAQFKGKSVGGVFGPVRSEYNGKEYERNEFRWFETIDRVPNAKVPALRDTTSGYKPATPRAVDKDEDIPF